MIVIRNLHYWCAFAHQKGDGRVQCTTENTGSTGYNGTAPVTTTTTPRTTTVAEITTTERDESELKCEEEKCDWQEAGEAQKEIHVVLKIIVLIKIVAIYF